MISMKLKKKIIHLLSIVIMFEAPSQMAQNVTPSSELKSIKCENGVFCFEFCRVYSLAGLTGIVIYFGEVWYGVHMWILSCYSVSWNDLGRMVL